MFRKPLALKVAGLLGITAGFFYILLSFDFATQIRMADPFANRDWRAILEETATAAGPHILNQVLGFLAAVLLIFFLVALAAHASKNHPSLAGMGGIFLTAAAGMLALRAIWVGFVQIPLAITYHGVSDPAYREALLNHYRLDIFTNLFFAWSYIFFAAVGLLLMALALSPVKDLFRLLPVAFVLSGLACTAFIPALAHVGTQVFMTRQFDRILASGFLFSVWFLPGLAFALAGVWLVREAAQMEMPQEQVQDLHLERAA